MQREDAAAFSRSGHSSMFGKRTADTRTKLSDLTKEKLRELWTSLGYQTESEFLADLIETRVHGVDHVVSVTRERVLAAAGIGSESGRPPGR